MEKKNVFITIIAIVVVVGVFVLGFFVGGDSSKNSNVNKNQPVIESSDNVEQILSNAQKESESIKESEMEELEYINVSEYLEEILKIYEYADNEYKGIFDYAYSGKLLYDANSRYAIKNGFSGAIALYGILDSTNSNLGTNYRLGMLLNTSYFLDEEYFKQVIAKNINSNHFPPNATIYSPIIHELGHKLHYDLVFKKYGINNFSITKNILSKYKLKVIHISQNQQQLFLLLFYCLLFKIIV